MASPEATNGYVIISRVNAAISAVISGMDSNNKHNKSTSGVSQRKKHFCINIISGCYPGYSSATFIDLHVSLFPQVPQK
jgi:hypothetical protein